MVTQARSRTTGLLLLAAAVVASFAIVVTSSGLDAASNPIAVEYSHDLLIRDSQSNEYVWDVGTTDAGSLWSFESSEPVPYELGIQSAFDPDESTASPKSSYQWEDLNKYAFGADSFFLGQTTEPVSVQSGLMLERRIQPDVLQPGSNSVSISVGLFSSREASIDDKTVDRTGGELWLKAKGNETVFEPGGLIGTGQDGLAPLQIVSTTGEPAMDLSSDFSAGSVQNLWMDAEIFNPNDVAVRYYPGFEAKVQVDSTPLGYVAPSGQENGTEYLGIETWSYGERAFFVLDSLDGSARDWEYDYSTRGLWHVFEESLEAAPGATASNEILILPLDEGSPGTGSELVDVTGDSSAPTSTDSATDTPVGTSDSDNGGVEIRVDSQQGFLGFTNPALGQTDGSVVQPTGPVDSSLGVPESDEANPDHSVIPVDEVSSQTEVEDTSDLKVTPPVEEPESQRGFFVNPAPGEGVDLPINNLTDPAVLSVIGILVTLFGATVQLARGK